MYFLKVYQIYFSEDQKSLLEPKYIPLKNEDCTVYFENSVIKTLIQEEKHFNSEYFGVVSYKLREKIGDIMQNKWRAISNIANHSLKTFEPELFEDELRKHKPDVMSFQCHVSHDPVSFANQFHPGFSEMFSQIMFQIGYHWRPEHYKFVSYCNFFVAKSTVYHEFVHKMLIPAMAVMYRMPELMQDSRYPSDLPLNLQERFGIKHYPYHSFLCERMFSYWCHLNKLKCLNY